MKAITISTLRKSIKKYFDIVSNSSEIIVIPRKSDKDGVVIMSIQEYNSLKETEHLLSSKVNRRRISESLNQVEKNELVEFNMND
ncbi:MAG: type II toxin-antitoxin system Phd/YefM family antitoxin [Candidatus Kapaibacterium sp.]|nr:type II toxin-antitoxin system Phd/YefM family antitoxin [Ignavibacteriota bacterium]MCB9221940.1 type II toxin-antitoxin system Phd/YefM family antitoxin [Ignavibacteria bacterium]